MEEWRVSEEIPNYEISSLGRIRNIKTGTIRNLYKGTGGYLRIVIGLDNRQRNFRVHQLVAKAFLPNPNSYTVVHHKDHNRSNNVVSNLEWTTPKQNTRYAIENGSFKAPSSKARLLDQIIKLQSEHNFILIQEMVEYLTPKPVLPAV